MIQRFFNFVREFVSTRVDWAVHTLSYYSNRYSSRKRGWDWSRPDYDYWRRAWYGRVEGVEIAGLFIKPIVNKIAAWTFGRKPYWKVSESDEANNEMADWWRKYHPKVLEAFRTALQLGDAFIVINPDLTPTILPPDVVDPVISEEDYTTIIGWRVEIEHPHPTDSHSVVKVIDEYYETHRFHQIWVDNRLETEQRFNNLIGRVPIVPIHNTRAAGAEFGRPEAEPLTTAFLEYNRVIKSGVQGNLLQGQPTPVMTFESKTDMEAFWDKHGSTENLLLSDGTTQKTTTVSVDLNELITLVNANFRYESPGAFAGEMATVLKILFFVVLEHSELPEFVFGNAIGASRASAEAQMPVFVRFLEMRQGEMVEWLLEVANVLIGYMSVLNPFVSFDDPEVYFDAVSNEDGRLTLDTVAWAYREGLLDAETALRVAPADFGNIQDILEQADEEREERSDRRGFGVSENGNDPRAVQTGENTSGQRPLAQKTDDDARIG